MKHKHAKHMIRYANDNSLKFQYKVSERDARWAEFNYQPVFDPAFEIREKPERIFADGAWYPVVSARGIRSICYFWDGRLYDMSPVDGVINYSVSPDGGDIRWIGEPIYVDWPEDA